MNLDLLAIFFTGLTVGGLTCMAVQGGLLASVIAAREQEGEKKNSVLPTLAFLSTKLAVYLVLGFILGAFSGALSISDTFRTIIQLLAGAYMIIIALDLLKVHPIFRHAVIQPPKFLTKMVRNQAKSKDLFAPAFLGVMTIFIPCGTTLAMEALAISSGSAFKGVAIMGAFILGTTPMFFGLGYLTTVLGDRLREKFFKVVAIIVLYFGLSSLNGSLFALGFPITWQSVTNNIPFTVSLGSSSQNSVQASDNSVKEENGVQVANIDVYPSGYSPEKITVKKGIPVKLNVTAREGYGCTSLFVIPQLRIKQRLSLNQAKVIEFTPQEVGKITWTCGMGMYTGEIEVTP